MKVSKTNIVEKWNEIKKYLDSATHDTYAQFLPEDFTDPEMEEYVKPFIDDVNEQLSNVSEDKPKPPTPTEPKKKPKSESKKGSKKEDSGKETGKKSGSNSKKSSSTPKKGANAGKKTDEAPKTEKKGKPKVGEPEPWQVTLRYFATYICGKEKTVTSIRKFVKQIQATFAAKLGNKTPHIDLIREIQEKLLPRANSTDKKITVPEWADLKKRCQEAARDKVVSKTVAKPEIKSAALSGLKKKRKQRKRK